MSLKKLLLISVLCLGCLLLSLSLGSVHLSWAECFHALWRSDASLAQRIIWQIRLPRVLTAFCVGGLLALSGNLLQVLLQNPLADPYVLGISGGAACAYLLASLLGISVLLLPACAFIGALCAMVLVLSLCWRSRWHRQGLLLTGIICAAFWGALNSLLLTVTSEQQVKGLLFWLIGDLQHTGVPYLGLISLSLGVLVSLLLAPGLDLLAGGRVRAQSLGLNSERLQWLIFILSSLLTAVAVTMAGTIGFVGLIIPQLLRLCLTNQQRQLIPLCVLVGGSFLSIADALARSLVSNQELPIGSVTAMIGVPIFLSLLSRRVDRRC